MSGWSSRLGKRKGRFYGVCAGGNWKGIYMLISWDEPLCRRMEFAVHAEVRELLWSLRLVDFNGDFVG